MKTYVFEGYGTDCFREINETHNELFLEWRIRNLQYKIIGVREEGIVVTGEFVKGEGPPDGRWRIGVELIDDDNPVDWSIIPQPGVNGYRNRLIVVAPEGALLQNCKGSMNRENTENETPELVDYDKVYRFLATKIRNGKLRGDCWFPVTPDWRVTSYEIKKSGKMRVYLRVESDGKDWETAVILYSGGKKQIEFDLVSGGNYKAYNYNHMYQLAEIAKGVERLRVALCGGVFNKFGGKKDVISDA